MMKLRYDGCIWLEENNPVICDCKFKMLFNKCTQEKIENGVKMELFEGDRVFSSAETVASIMVFMKENGIIFDDEYKTVEVIGDVVCITAYGEALKKLS
jgi:hypothetical protein